MLNGRITPELNDWTNVSTTANRGGLSVVDWFICDKPGIKYFKSLKVEPYVDFLERCNLINSVAST